MADKTWQPCLVSSSFAVKWTDNFARHPGWNPIAPVHNACHGRSQLTNTCVNTWPLSWPLPLIPMVGIFPWLSCVTPSFIPASSTPDAHPPPPFPGPFHTHVLLVMTCPLCGVQSNQIFGQAEGHIVVQSSMTDSHLLQSQFGDKPLICNYAKWTNKSTPVRFSIGSGRRPWFGRVWWCRGSAGIKASQRKGGAVIGQRYLAARL